jgi:hypothetical protein
MNRTADAHLILDYRPSQPTGWPGQVSGKVGKTIGGHTSSREFTVSGKRYRISLIPFGPGNSPDPVYEPVPSDPAVDFRRTLAGRFGAYYSFRYRGGLGGRDELSVQCYSVFAQQGGAAFGAELYVAYHPDVRRGDPPARADLKWIQVARWTGTGGPSPARYLDSGARANPFYITGGLISVFGTQVFNFDNLIEAQAPRGAGGGTALSATYVAEAFLARDTGAKDAAGKDVIELSGGIRYGWELREVPA